MSNSTKKIKVLKFGGTSVKNPQRIAHVAQIVASVSADYKTIVVVSAMGDTTDSLVRLAGRCSDKPNPRELDVLLASGEQQSIALLSIVLSDLAIKAKSFTGGQLGIITESNYGNAEILSIDAGKIDEAFVDNDVIVVAGFQGVTAAGDITTLGRGGSDTSAVAIAAAVGAELCDIYTDVDGVYTADPRIVKGARKLDEISYDEMLELASLGAKVMQSRSVEFAKKFKVIFSVRSSMNDNPGTIVKEETRKMEDVVIRGVTVDKNQSKVTISKVPDKPGVAARIFKALSDANVNVDMIVQNVSASGHTDMTFTMGKDDLIKAKKVIEPLVQEVRASGFESMEGIAKLSVVGIGMRSHAGVAADLFEALAHEKINIQMISTSEIKISVVIELAHAERAMNVVHAKFGLG